MLAPAGAGWELQPADVRISEGLIAGLERPGSATEGVDATGCVVAPGLVNAHYHSHDQLLRGLGERLPLELWSLRLASRRRFFGPREHYVSAALGALELLRGGCTTVVDHVRTEPPADPECLAAVAEAYEHAGIRAWIAPVVADVRLTETLPVGRQRFVESDVDRSPPPAETQLSHVDDLAHHVHGGTPRRIRVAVGPSAPHRCTDGLLRGAAEWASGARSFVHMHALETRLQREQAASLYGGSAIRHLDEVGVLEAPTQLVHLVWASPDEIRLLAERDVLAVHCPVSNAFLGSGVAPVPEMRASGVRIALGTDSVTCNGSSSMLETMKWCHLIHSVPRSGSPIPAASVLEMSTISPSSCSTTRQWTGPIRLGAAADFVLIDATAPGMNPLNSPVDQIVDGIGSDAVVAVIVDGIVVYERGSALLDPLMLQAEAYQFAQDLPKALETRALQRSLWAHYGRSSSDDAGA